MQANHPSAFSKTRRVAAILFLVVPLAGCGAHWDTSWNESGRAYRAGGYDSYGGYRGRTCIDGDAVSAIVILGIAGIAWGIGELFEALGGR